MNASIASARASSSGARRMEEGCTVASTCGASGEGIHSPRCSVTRKRPPEQRLRGGGAETDQHPRPEHGELGLQPGPAGLDLQLVRLGVDAALPGASLELEVLHRVGDVGPAPVDPDRGQALVQHPAGRTDEGMSREVLLVARAARRRASRPGEPGPPRRRSGSRGATGRSPGSPSRRAGALAGRRRLAPRARRSSSACAVACREGKHVRAHGLGLRRPPPEERSAPRPLGGARRAHGMAGLRPRHPGVPLRRRALRTGGAPGRVPAARPACGRGTPGAGGGARRGGGGARGGPGAGLHQDARPPALGTPTVRPALGGAGRGRGPGRADALRRQPLGPPGHRAVPRSPEHPGAGA